MSEWYVFGPQGETRYTTNAQGQISGSFGYTAWGNLIAANSQLWNPFLYGGQFGYYTVNSSALVLCGARWYAPTLGHWLSRDPQGYQGGDNLYCYCDGDPVNGVDPTGLDVVVLIGTNRKRPKSFFSDHAHQLQGHIPDKNLAAIFAKHKKQYFVCAKPQDAINALNKVRSIDALIYVGHAGPGALILSGNGVTDVRITAKEVATLPSNHLVRGAPIALYGCHTAEVPKDKRRTVLGPSIAQLFADHYHRKVQAIDGGLSFGNATRWYSPWNILNPDTGKLRPEGGKGFVTVSPKPNIGVH